jgi:hypothetical protein
MVLWLIFANSLLTKLKKKTPFLCLTVTLFWEPADKVRNAQWFYFCYRRMMSMELEIFDFLKYVCIDRL